MGLSTALRETVETILVALLLALLLRGFVVDSIVVQGYSMEPSLHHGERLLVNKIVYRFRPPERGDVVVFRYPLDPSRDFIKRVVGRPGDRVEVMDGVVYINGQPVDEPYVNNLGGSNLGPQVIPPDTLFVMGDNRINSEDSRYFGPVPVKSIKGRAFFIFWPPGGVRLLTPDLAGTWSW